MATIEEQLKEAIREVVREELGKLNTKATAEYLSTKTAGEIAEVVPRTVRRWIQLGYLPSYKLGDGVIRVKRSEVETFIRKGVQVDRPLSVEELVRRDFA